MTYADPITLSDEIVSLVPLSLDYEADLKEASEDGELWKLWYTTVPKPADVRAEIDRRLGLQKSGSMCPFAIVENATGKAVGMTTYMNIDDANRRLEIGSTWYRKSVQRSGFNTRCKLMLLTHAFEEYNCNAVEFCTHFMNRQSRTAIERLGAKLDGVLRSHKMMPDGSLRDTCVYSILAHEWPTVKTHLTFQRDKTR